MDRLIIRIWAPVVEIIFYIIRSSYKVCEFNMGVCPRLAFDDITLIYFRGYDFYIYGDFDFLCNSIVNY